MLLCSLAASAHDFSVGGIYYNISSSTNLTVAVTYRGGSYSQYSNEYTGAVTIPATVTYNSKTYSVTSIGGLAFSDCSSLTSITLPEGVTSIGSSAFFNCSSLTSITLPEGVTSIGSSAFAYCYSLTCITIPEGVTSIGDRAFFNCSSLTDITIPENLQLTSIGNEAFRDCYCLTSITIPESVTSIGSSAFFNCSSLTSITLPESVTSIGGSAFSGCSRLTSITLPENSQLTSIGNEAFRDCSSLTSIILPEGVTSIGNYAFYNCSSLTSITLPESVTSIGSSAFDNCGSLKTVINYSDLIIQRGSSDYGYVGYYADKVFNLDEFMDGYAFKTTDGVYYMTGYIGEDTELTLPKNYRGKNYQIGARAFHSYSNLTAINIPEGVTNIGDYAFDNCTALKKVIIEDGNTTLSLGYNYYSGGTGGGLFYDCPLEEVYLGRNLSYESGKSYGYSPFYNKDALTNVTIGDEVTAISQYAFYSCDNIHSLTIPSGVLSIGNSAFSTPEKVIWLTNTPPTGYANAKGSINYAANDQHSSLSNLRVYPYLSSIFEVDGVKYVPVSPAERTCDAIDCAYNSTAAAINVSETASFKGIAMTVKEVMPYAFYGNKHIKEVNISHKGNIGNYAFYDCDSVQNVELSNEGNVGSQAFYDCDGILTATISNQGNIESQAFYDCDGIKSLDISNVGYVGDEAFRGCGALETAIVANTGAVNSSAFYNCVSLKSVTLGDKVTSLGNDAFRGCRSLQEIVIPNSVKSVGAYCFSSCSAMKSAVIGDGVPNIAQYTFQNCTGLTNVMVGDGVTTINNYAFTGCSALTNVTLGRSVATINNYAFQNCSSLPEITLPQAVTKVGDYVFAGCSKLADVVIADRTAALALGSNGSSPLFADCPLDSIYIGGKITYNTTSSKGYSPFYRNTSLRTVVITDREEQIYDNEFYGCTNLQNVTIGNGVKSIGNYAFSGCSSLDKFAFGSSMQRIGEEAFSDCTNLTEICSSAMNPPTCGTQALDDINKWNCILKVPTGYMAAYQAADQWKEFFFIEDIVEVATYTLTFMVDGEVYHTVELPCEAAVTMPATPTKEGHTFSGWDKTLSTMPAEDVTISGTFTINKYLVTFKVDGEIVYSESLEYGASIVVPEVPEKEGHTFNGWGEVPETMPAHDVTLNGTFTVNKYLVTFTVDGAVIASDSLEYGTAITVPTMPEREGYTFSGWSEVAETVPAHNVTYDASYTANTYKVHYFVGATLVHTAEVAYGEAIPEYVYEPTAEGDVFMGWIGETYETMPAHDVTYTANITNDVLQLTNDNSQMTIHDLSGRKVTDTENLKGGIYIVNGKKVVINNK